MRVVILGAGLAGLSAAYHLGKKGIDYTVYEKELTPGGLCRTNTYGDYNFDYGVHVVWGGAKDFVKFVEKDLKIDLNWFNRDVVINHYDQYIPYPFQFHFDELPKYKVCKILLSYLKRTHNGIDNYSEWLNYEFGEEMVKEFLGPYNKKFWKSDLSKLCVATSKGLPVPSLEDIVTKLIQGKDTNFGGNAEFAYPKSGKIQTITDTMAENLNINYGSAAMNIDLKNKDILFSDGSDGHYDILISSIPLSEFASKSGLEKENKLKSVGVYSTLVVIDDVFPLDYHWVYYTDPGVCFYRLTPLCQYGGTGDSFIVESTFSKRSYPINKVETSIKESLEKVGIINRHIKIKSMKTITIDPAYVKFDMNYGETTSNICRALPPSVRLIGRYGTWRYASMHEAWQDGKEVSQEI